MTRIPCLFILMLGLPACLLAGNQILVTTQAGVLEGALADPAPVYAFKGVPYAAPPVGALRWRAPRPATPWRGVRQATQFGPSPMQTLHGDFLPWTREFLVQNAVSEDCLYLNVWTPKPGTGAKLPVLVYIPGGAFTEGSGEVPIYDGTRLAKRGVVVVTINYRLGVFGFFAYPGLTAESAHHASGNYGLMDQIAALRWVRRNIAAFGGDPARVTVWGQSAGAMSVGVLLVSERAHGLFSAAIANSGIGYTSLPMPSLAEAEAAGMKLAESHHVRGLKALRELPAAELATWTRYGMGPIVDGWVLSKSEQTLLKEGAGSDVPVLVGNVANDGLLSLPRLQTLEAWRAYSTSTYGRFAAEYRTLYPAGEAAEIRDSLLAAARDRERVSLYLWAKLRQTRARAPIYTYFFTRGVPWPQHPEFGAFHSGDLPYFFDNLVVLDRPWTEEDRRLATEASAYLRHFAARGNPNGPGLPDWAPVDPARPATFELGANLRAMPLADQAKVDFWNRVLTSDVAARLPLF